MTGPNRGLVYDPEALPETCSDDTHADGCPCRTGGDEELEKETPTTD